MGVSWKGGWDEREVKIMFCRIQSGHFLFVSLGSCAVETMNTNEYIFINAADTDGNANRERITKTSTIIIPLVQPK